MEPTLPAGHVDSGGARIGRGHGGRRINLVKLAEAQRILIWCVLVRLLVELAPLGFSGALPPVVGGAYIVIWLVMQAVTIAMVARMAKAFGHGWVMAVLGSLLIVLPCAGLILLVVLNQRVIGTLQREGAKVGFMGVNAAQMNKLREGVCSGCGYDIRGLKDPICPECGRPLTGLRGA